MTSSRDKGKSPMKESGGIERFFLVYYFDGAATHLVDYMSVKPSLNFDAFQSYISNKINVSPDLFTVYYERSRFIVPCPAGKIPGTLENPITDGFNFGTLFSRYKYHFLAVLKRGNLENTSPVAFFDGTALSHPGRISAKPPMKFEDFRSAVGKQIGYSPEHFTIYHERCPVPDPSPACKIPGKRKNPVADNNTFSSMCLGDDYYFLAVLKQNSRRGQSSKKKPIPNCQFPLNHGGASTSSSGVLSCDVCTRARIAGETAPFHPCIRDPILTTPFRSPYGPIIARPWSIPDDLDGPSMWSDGPLMWSGGGMWGPPKCECATRHGMKVGRQRSTVVHAILLPTYFK